MKTTTAIKTLYRHGWNTAPDTETAVTLVQHIEASGDDSLNGEPMTLAEIRALRALASGPDYRIESAKGTFALRATNRADALREAREWQRNMQAAYADLIGPRGGSVRL